MTTLSEQINLLEEQLDLSQQAGHAKHILNEYEVIRKQLSEAEDSLRVMHSRFQVLQALPEDVPQKMEFSGEVREVAKRALFLLQTFSTRWEAERHESRQGNELRVATESLKSLSVIGKAEVDKCWRRWVELLKSLVALEDLLLESQKSIPGLEKTYNDFVKNRHQFIELVDKFPQNAQDIKRLQELSATMQSLKEKMQFDLPEDVATFFKQLDGLNHRVSLAAITPEVFDWLRSQNLLDAYVISRRGSVRGY